MNSSSIMSALTLVQMMAERKLDQWPATRSLVTCCCARELQKPSQPAYHVLRIFLSFMSKSRELTIAYCATPSHSKHHHSDSASLADALFALTWLGLKLQLWIQKAQVQSALIDHEFTFVTSWIWHPVRCEM